jgi:transposase
MEWIDQSGERTQRILFATSLDEAIPADHPLRLFVEIIGRLDLGALTQGYSPGLGRPGIHPRVMVSVLLWGLLSGVRSSRKLEEALQYRLDFRWLTGGLSIDHSTLNLFRHSRKQELKALFQQVVLLAQEVGLVDFRRAAFDGTRVKANNRRSGSRTAAELHSERAAAAKLFDELEAVAAREDAERVPGLEALSAPLSVPLMDAGRRLATIDAALAELARAEAAGEALPSRIPITDPQSRIMPNKEGGFAPNYTPTALVDVKSGIVTDCDVTSEISDDSLVLPAIQRVQDNFGDKAKPAELLADQAFPTGYNLTQLEAAGIDCYSPTDVTAPAQHPARRADPTQPVSAEQLGQLPLMTKPKSGKLPEDQRRQFAKGAFLYDEANDVYYCPQGKTLTFRNISPEQRRGQPKVLRKRYESQPADCSGCPLRQKCLQDATTTKRTVSRDQYEPVRERHATRMAPPAAQDIYQLRRHAGERPFAFIKQNLGARQFLLRGLNRVKQEWRWLVTAFNIRCLLSAWPSRAGPAANPSPMPATAGG